MTERLKDYLKKAAEAVKAHSGAKQDSMRIVCMYGAGLLLITLLLLCGWSWQWYQSGKPDITALISFFREYTSASVVAAVTFLSVFHVDKNGDGRPDAAEAQAEGVRK